MVVFNWMCYGRLLTIKADSGDELSRIFYAMTKKLDQMGETAISFKALDIVKGLRKELNLNDQYIWRKGIETLISEFGIGTDPVMEHGTGFSRLLNSHELPQ